jgi:ZIP family zinc transporter
MLAASFFSLIIPGIKHAEKLLGGTTLAVLVIIAALMLGAIALSAINRYAPHEHFILGPKGVETAALQRIWLFVIAITLHNFPEGLAVGVGYGGGDIASGNALAIGIGPRRGDRPAVARLFQIHRVRHRRGDGPG